MSDTRHTVMVIDDDAATRRLLVGELQAAGHPVVSASDALEALTLLAEARPRIVITDWIMPGLSGVELCRALRHEAADPFRYIMMLTVNSLAPQLIEAFEAGVDDFLPKPVEPGVLLASMRAAVRAIDLQTQLADRNRELEAANERLARLATTDDLTGLANRRRGLERLREAWDFARRYERPLACALIDIDHFKRINDTYGHWVGDSVLQSVASGLAATCRTTDVVARHGGEEFLLVMPEQTLEQASQAVTRGKEAVAAARVEAGGVAIGATVSAGVACKDSCIDSPEALIRAADDALYDAKAAGRNQVRTAA